MGLSVIIEGPVLSENGASSPHFNFNFRSDNFGRSEKFLAHYNFPVSGWRYCTRFLLGYMIRNCYSLQNGKDTLIYRHVGAELKLGDI